MRVAADDICAPPHTRHPTGPPGCGKGTQSPKIVNEFCVCHLATGDMLRAAVAAKTPLGIKAKAKMEAGELVSDDLVVGIIKDAIKRPDCSKGFILDGFPRSMEQARKLDEMLAESGDKVTKVVNFKVDDETVVKRISGRWVHKPSGRSYHTTFAPPKVPGKDDITGEPLVQRSDDVVSTVQTRLNTFRKTTEPLLDFYAGQGKLASVNAVGPIDRVWRDVMSALES